MGEDWYKTPWWMWLVVVVMIVGYFAGLTWVGLMMGYTF